MQIQNGVNGELGVIMFRLLSATEKGLVIAVLRGDGLEGTLRPVTVM